MDWASYERRARLVARQCAGNEDLVDYCLDSALSAVTRNAAGNYEHDGLWLQHRRRDYAALHRVRFEEAEKGNETAAGVIPGPETVLFRRIAEAELWERIETGIDVLVERPTARARCKAIAKALLDGCSPVEVSKNLGITKMTVSRTVAMLQAILV